MPADTLPLRHRDPPQAEPAVVERLLTTQEVADLLRVSPKTLWTLTKNGEIVSVKIGGKVLYDPADVRAFIDKRKVGASVNGRKQV